jgi:6-phosphogluconolactonase
MAASDAGLTLDEGAAAYAAELARFGDDDRAWPSFAVCFLGVGPDGHIASLFPDRPEITVIDAAVLPVRDSPKPPPERITLTRPVINASKRVWLVLTGADKASALGLALAGANYENVPAAGAKGRKRTVFFVDEAAASEVAPDLIDVDY